MTQHAELSAERWGRFSLGQQILQIAVELERGTSSLRADRRESLRLGYERVLRLVDLSVEVNARHSLRRELLRWRGVIADLYLGDSPDPAAHREALEVLLQLHPEAAAQLPDLGP